MCGLLEMEQTREKCFANSELELLRRKAHHMKDEGAKLSRAATHNRDILSQCYYVDRRIMLYAFEELTPYQKLKVWDPGQAIVFHDKTFPSYGDVITVSITDFLGLEDKAVILPGSTLKFYGEKSEEQQQRFNTLVSELSLLMALGTTPAVWWLCAVMIGATAIRDTMEIRAITVLRTFLIVEGSSRQLWNMSRQEELICATLFYLNEKINETRDSVNDLTETASVQSKEVKQAQHISAATNHTSSNLTCGDIHVMVEYKSTQIVVIGFAWDPMDRPTRGKLQIMVAREEPFTSTYYLAQTPPPDSFVTAYLVLFFTGMEEVMDFYFYDWFQSPRPPELNDHDNGARVITLRTFHQLEDKLVLHRGSIDKSPNGL